MRCKRLIVLIVLMSTSWGAFAQQADSLFLRDDALTFDDSLAIFNLIDSLLEYGEPLGSQVAMRVGYNSNVLSAGRTLGIENFGLAPAVSYYHKSGAYADVTGYWSQDFKPSYYLTVASVGYMHTFSKHFSAIANFDRYFYTDIGDSYVPYKNTLSVTPMVDFKPVMLSVNYSFYFGDDYAHRIMPGLTVTLEKKKFWIFDRVAIAPSFFALYGNETLTSVVIDIPPTLREKLQNLRKYGTIYSVTYIDKNVFGVMNYAATVPLLINYKNFGLSLSYTYAMPQALPGEPLTLSESSYLSGSLTYFFKGFRNYRLRY